MSLLSWNYRGFGSLQTNCTLQRAVQQEAPSLVFLMESKLSMEEMKKKRDLAGFKNGYIILSQKKNGGLAVLWNHGTDVAIQGSNRWYIDAVIDG